MKLSLILADPTHWCKGSFARDAAGNPKNIGDDESVSFCLVGACVRFGHDGIKLGHEAAKRGFGSIAMLNDSLTHPELLTMLEGLGL